MSKQVKLVVTVPESHADALREALGKAGAGLVGNYHFCSFSVKGVGRFRPFKGARPSVGKVGRFETVAEERIEMICDRRLLKKVLKALRAAHPYEEPAIDVYLLEEIS